MTVLRRIVSIALLAMFSLALTASAQENDASRGRQLFLQYCASCHGLNGAGDGPVAKALTKRPANLRLLSEKYGSPLGVSALAEIIDGRKAVRAHGTHEMPVWGERLYATSQGNQGETGISDTLRQIIVYLNTIQDQKTASR